MIMLLSSRGRARRSKSGSSVLGSSVLGSLTQAVSGLFGGRGSSQSRSGRDAAKSVPGWLALGAALACFGVGFVVGGKFGPKEAQAGLDARASTRTPGVIGESETVVLSATSYVVSAYPDPDETIALDKARSLCTYLKGVGLQKARPYLLNGPKGPVWTVVVYYDGETEMVATRDRLRALSNVPDPQFEQLRQENAPGDWPIPMPIR